MNKYKIFQRKLIAELNNNKLERPLGKILMELFDQSKSVVYKKLRCQAPFSLSEYLLILDHFNISTNTIEENPIKNGLDIELMPLVKSFETLTQYLTHAHAQLTIYRQLPEFKMWYVARDLPLFHYFKHKELGALKALVWVHESYKKKLKIKDVPQSLLEAGKKMYQLYTQLNCTEIWSEQTIDNTLNQVVYYYSLKMITDVDAEIILHQLKLLLKEEREALMEGNKNGEAQIDLILSPFIMMSNGAFMKFGKVKSAMMAISTIQTIVVHDKSLLTSLETSFKYQLKHGKSLVNSSVADIEYFFDGLLSKVEKTEGLIV